ncbi:MAG: iron uptake porin [Prochlorococcus marinus CUG1434]|nr:iron uptake porin [Prochlorococcus marinus CUG1434]
MKLFQKLLVASTALGLLTPIAAQATEAVNLDDMDSYRRSSSKVKKFDSNTFANEISEDVATLNGRVDGLEARQNNFEAGSFSSTTTMDGKAVFAVGAVDGGDTIGGSEALSFSYVYKMNLNTSFTGDDNLYVRLSAGEWGSNFTKKPGNYHIEAKNTGNDLIVDKIWYTFPLGDNATVWVGPAIENYYMMAATPSIYKPGVLKAFKLGGNGAVFGASTDGGAGLKYEFGDSGLAMSTNYVGKGSGSSKGILTDSDKSKIDTMIAFTKPQYHASVTYSKQHAGWDAHEYYSTELIHGNVGSSTKLSSDTNADAYALRAYWRPEDSGTAMPEISVGYDSISFDNHPLNVTEGSGYFVGLGWQDMIQADDRIGIALGQPVKATQVSTGTLSEVEPFLWEAYYSFKPNDSITVTPAVWGGTDVESSTDQDVFGAMLTTVFKF